MVKGGDWISDAAGNPTISGPELTHVSDTTFGITSPQLFIPQLYYMHKPLTSNGFK